MEKKGRKDNSNSGKYSSDSDSDSLYDIESSGEDNLYTLQEDDQEDDFSPFQSYRLNDDAKSGEKIFSDDTLHQKAQETYHDRTDANDVDDETDEEDDEEEEDEEEEDEEEEDEENSEKGNLLLLLFKILSTPVEGWKEFKRRGYTPDEVARGCFFPLLFLASLSDFTPKLYGHYITTGECVMQALVTFVSFFFGYFCVTLIGRSILPKGSREIFQNNFGKEFVMINVSSLALFYMAIRLFPMLDAILVFLPIWTIYIIYKGVRFLRVPAQIETRTKVILTFLILGLPYMWTVLLEIFFNL
ncbi:MAG: hypothetical protein K2J70_00260 [Muribaculaceae bacterium]|nr:hypothetical protein [Muribaculaceae bacterium]